MLFQSFDLHLTLPFYSSLLSAGFPSPAEDYVEKSIDLNQLLVKKPASTFMMRLASSSMTGAGILRGDVLVIDRSLNPKNQDLVVVAIEGELLLKRLVIVDSQKYLLTENLTSQKTKLEGEDQIWGVVTGVVRTMKS